MLLRAAAQVVLNCWLLMLVVCFPLSLSAADLPQNLMTNPSLEDPVDASGYPPGWGKFYSVPAGAYKYSIVDGGRTGKKQVRIDIADGNADGQFGAMAANRIALDRTKRYVARGWAKVAGKYATADVKLHYYDAGGAYLGQTRIGFTKPGNDDWQLVTVTDQAENFPDAKLIGLAFACTGDAKAQYDDLELLAFDKDSLPPNFDETYGITLSPQVAIIARRLGVWDRKMKIKPSLKFPQGLETTSVEQVRWVLPGMVLETHGKDSKSGHEQYSLMAYDDRDQVYRNWYFGSDGTMPRENTIGRWNPTANEMTFESKAEDDSVFISRMKYISEDEIHWQGSQKNKQGQVMLDYEALLTRHQGDNVAAGSPGRSSTTKPVTAVAPIRSNEATTELDGTWQAESLKINGEVAPAAAVKNTWFKIKETAVEFKMDGPLLKGKLLVDTGKSPKWIDLSVAESQAVELHRLLGIYQLKGDQLALCLIPADDKNTRPDGFASKQGTQSILVVLRKQKE